MQEYRLKKMILAKEQSKYESLIEKHQELFEEYNAISWKITDKKYRFSQIGLLIDELEKAPDLIEEFDEVLWNVFVYCVSVDGNGKMTVMYKDGTQMSLF